MSERNEWRPIEELPDEYKDGRRIWLIDTSDGFSEACWGEWLDGEWRDIGDIGCNGQWEYEPTHWRLPPDPPPPPKGSIPASEWMPVSNLGHG